MSGSRWSIAEAKAEFSNVVRRAQVEPQVVENRGEPVAVVIGIEEYQRTAERPLARARWQAFLHRTDAMVAAGGGVDLETPPRTPRRDPFASRPAPRRRR